MTVVVAEDQEQVDKLIRLKEDYAAYRANPSGGTAGPDPAYQMYTDMPPLLLETVIYYDPHGLEQYTDSYLLDFTEVEAKGNAWGREHPGWLEEQVAAGTSEDIAVICTTSGTTSRPKLAELSHANLLAMADHLTTIDPIDTKDRYVSFLPCAWIGEQMLAVECGLSKGLTLSLSLIHI